jgi:hypothetical protein
LDIRKGCHDTLRVVLHGLADGSAEPSPSQKKTLSQMDDAILILAGYANGFPKKQYAT